MLKWGGGNSRAFTLVELLVVIAIIGILIALLLPTGVFKVLVSKIETYPGPEIPPEPDPQKDRGAWARWNQQYNGPHMMTNSYNVVEADYANRNKTPLEIEVKSGKNTFNLDAGKSVRILIKR